MTHPNHQNATAPHPAPEPTPEPEGTALPSGWVETTLGELNIYRSANVDPAAFPNEVFELYSVPIFPTGKPEIQTGAAIGSTKQTVAPNDVLICKINPRINRVWKVGEAGEHRQIGSSEWIVFRAPEVSASFYTHFFKSAEFRERLCEDLTGVGGSLTRAQPVRVATFPLPLPPLPEQIRIADKLDALLARVEAGRERLARMPALLARLRQSILSAAVSGELTQEWRGGGDAEWEEVELGKIAPDITYGYTASSTTQPIGPKMLRITDIQDDAVNWDTVPFCEIGKLERQKYLLQAGDLVFARTGATVGKSYLIRGEIPESVYASYLIRVRPKNPMDALYLKYFFQSPNYWQQVMDLSAGIGQPNVNGSKLKSLSVPLPPLPEQAEIVRRVELLFARVDDLERQYQAAARHFDTLTPALLQKAFRGELVPQDPNDEPASVLLERIRAARAAAGEKPKRGRGAAKAKATAQASGPEVKRRGRPRKTEAASSEAEAVAQGPEPKRATGTRQVGLFED